MTWEPGIASENTLLATNTKLDSIVSNAYNSDLDVYEIVEQAPLDQQVLSETLLNAVTSTGASTAVNVQDKSQLAIQYVATGVSSGATLKIQGSNDNSNWADVALKKNDGTFAAGSITISATGTAIYQLEQVGFMYLRANLSARTDGTYTVTLSGRA